MIVIIEIATEIANENAILVIATVIVKGRNQTFTVDVCFFSRRLLVSVFLFFFFFFSCCMEALGSSLLHKSNQLQLFLQN